MVDRETFLTELYVAVDDFCKSRGDPAPRPGPAGGLTTSEVVTLALYAQETRFVSERAFHHHADRVLRPLFPGLPGRDRFNRLRRRCGEAITAFALFLGRSLATGDEGGFEALDGTGLEVRNAKRRGAGWLCGQADIGWCTRVGWYEGVRLLLSVTPGGVVTGWGMGPASTNDRVLAETFFAARAQGSPHLPSVGRPTSDRYLADMGFSGLRCQARWAATYGAIVVSPTQTGSARVWSKPLRTWLASKRQVIEAVNDRLLFRCGLNRERPHTLDGLLARVAAAMGLHNLRCWLNRRDGRGLLQVADLLEP